MTNSEPSRLDRIEALLELIATDLANAKDLAISNARAIEASRAEFSQLRQEWQIDRSRLYKAMADLANAQVNVYHRLEDLDERQGELSRRQGEIVEILKLLSGQDRS
ncbi:MAG: hypothetical protein AB4426_29120 [Xenococcaceae cyanobacterium]